MTGGDRPELADVGRLARRLVRQAVHVARAEEASIQRLLADHLGGQAAALPVASGSWQRYDQVNVQAGLDAWLAEPGRSHEIAGITGFRHQTFGLADLAQPAATSTGAWAASPPTCCPPGRTGPPWPACSARSTWSTTPTARWRCWPGGPRSTAPGGVHRRGQWPAAPGRASGLGGDIRATDRSERNVFRGPSSSSAGRSSGTTAAAPLQLPDRPHIAREHVILPPEVLGGIERQVIGVARHAALLLASGQHLKQRRPAATARPAPARPTSSATCSASCPGVTVVLLSGRALGMIAQACSVARTLQPSVVVVEDVDLIAEQRESHGEGEHPLLFQLLNEMDGLGELTWTSRSC